jgi:hypothetical protein
MKIPRSKLLGIFGGEEIYCTGAVHTPSRKSVYNIFGGDKFSGASSGVWTTPSNQKAPPHKEGRGKNFWNKAKPPAACRMFRRAVRLDSPAGGLFQTRGKHFLGDNMAKDKQKIGVTREFFALENYPRRRLQRS